MNFNELKKFIDKITDWRIPGAECEVYVDNQRVFKYGAGYANLETKKPIDGSLYYLYSTTKVATSTAVLQLLERGEILLTDPIKEYLPEFSEMYIEKDLGDGKTELVRAQNDITISHLLSMSSGLDYNWKAPAIQEVREKTNGISPTREIVRAIAKSPLRFEPGEHWAYGLSADVLGGLVEVVSGKLFSEYVQENIFDPVGMKNSTFRYTEKVAKKMATKYGYDEETNTVIDTGNINNHSTGIGSEYDSGGAGIISNVEDYAKFASTLANGGVAPNGERILSSGTVELMKTNLLSESALKDIVWPQIRGYGYGCIVRTMMDKGKAGTTGTLNEFGWGGAAGSYLLADTEKKLGVFYVQHMVNSQEPYVHPRLRNIVYSALEK